jgi:DNA-binding transcriptional MerR regulator
MSHGVYTIEVVAREARTSKWALRHYQKLGLLPKVKSASNGLNYDDDYIRRARQIRDYLELYPRGPLENLRERLRKPNCRVVDP